MIALAGFLLTSVAFFTASGYSGGESSQIGPTRFGIDGYLIAFPSPAEAKRRSLATGIFVPGVTARLRIAGTGTPVGSAVRTDLSGRFVFPPQKFGKYQVCWKAVGFLSGCAKPFGIAGQNVHLGPLQIRPVAASGRTTYYGNVTLADGSPPRTYEPLENVNGFAVVRTTGVTPKLSAYVNDYGEYILPAVAGKVVKLQAAIEAASVTKPGVSSSTGAREVDLAFKNHPPTLVGVVASTPGGHHWTAKAGQIVKVSALGKDADGDVLRYRWLLPNGKSATGPTVVYKLPKLAGTYEFTVVAYDRKGGYTTDSVQVATRGVRFAGVVSATDRPVVAGARVEVGGVTTTTDATGAFSLYVPEQPRYVLNIHKDGYGPVSKIYDNGLTGGAWTLTRATVATVDPTKPIDVVNVRRPGDCPGSFSDQLKRQGKPTECGPGIRVQIPANSLVDANGKPPSGPVQISLTTVDLPSRDGMPGDFTAVDPSGQPSYIESYGAGTVEISAGGTAYNLSPGAQATVTIPIAPEQLAAPTPPPATIPLLYYDQTRGVWLNEGTAQLQGNTYVGNVSHFSAINTDLEKHTPSCVRFDATVMPSTFDLDFTVPLSSGGTHSYTFHVTNSTQRFHVIYRVPNNVNMTVSAFDTSSGSATPISLNFNGTQTNTLTVNTGPPQNPQTPIFPAFPYTACQTSVELIPFRLPDQVQHEFLDGLYSFQAQNLTELDVTNPTLAGTARTAAQTYYDTIDPQHRRLDLADFKAVNGFGSSSGTEVQAYYANSGDLGFGRDMHCHKNGADVACYVTNYGNRFTDDVQDYKDAVDNNTPIATVGMEYTRVENPTGSGFQQATSGGDLRMVKFYVFGHNTPSTDPSHAGQGDGRVVSADLDGFGQRPVPALCMTCHGGLYPSGPTTGVPTWNTANANSANLNSSFIPFDLGNFTIVPYLQTSSASTISQASEEANFKSLNQDFVLATNPPSATQEVINAMYAGGSPTQIPNFVVSGWSSDPQTYTKVVAPSCRSCHISLGRSNIAWNSALQLSNDALSVAYYVCTSHQMPHAKVTHNRFWLSTNPHQPPILSAFLVAHGASNGTDCNQ
jgi:hypothetical protein